MSLPVFDPTAPVPSTFIIDLEKKFPAQSRFRIFAEKVYPLLCQAREKLVALPAYCLDNGAMAIEPVWKDKMGRI